MEEVARMERNVVIQSWKRNSYQGCCSIHTDIHHECFPTSYKLCDELDNLCAKFWWGQVGNERKIHWKNWDKLSTSKREGGMGFQDLRDFNLAMLAKQDFNFYDKVF